MGEVTPRLSIVMPVYNESENILPVLEAVQREVKTRPIEVLVVYDFDEDNTIAVANRIKATFPESAWYAMTSVGACSTRCARASRWRARPMCW